MKTFVLYLIFCFGIVGITWANDAPIVFTSKGLQLTSENRVQLTKEEILIRVHSYKSLEELRFKADYDCTLYFENVSNNAVTIETVFPFEQFYSDEIVDYNISVNQHEIPFSKQEHLQTKNQKYSAMFLSQISFQPQTTTRVKHSYSLISKDYGAPLMILEYLFSTGKRWRKTQTKCDVILLLDQDMLPFLSLIEPAGFEVTKNNRIEWHFNQLPEQDLYIEFHDDMHYGMRYSLEVDSKEHELLPHNIQEGYELSKLERSLHNPGISPALRNFILYLLGANYMSDHPEKAIPYMKQLAEFTEYTDYYLLHDLTECLLAQGDIASAQPYLQVLADQKDSPGFSIYAQLILQEYGLKNTPLSLEFPKKQTFFEWYKEVVLHKNSMQMRTLFPWCILLLMLSVVYLGSYLVWRGDRLRIWKNSSVCYAIFRPLCYFDRKLTGTQFGHDSE